MKKIMIYSLVFLFAFSLQAQESLELIIQTDKTEFELGEPVVLYVSLKNISDDPIEVMRFLEADYGFVQYSIKAPEGIEKSFLPWALKENTAPQQMLSPGEAIRKEAKIFFGSSGWSFTEPGNYEINAVYTTKVRSNSIVITILAPDDEPTQRAADSFLESEEVGFFLLFEGGDHLMDGIRLLEQVAASLPNTLHAAYANFALGANLRQDFANFEENRLREAEPRRAIEFLEIAKANPVSFHQIVYTYIALIEGYTDLGELPRAETVRRELNQVISERYPDFLPLLNDILIRKGIE